MKPRAVPVSVILLAASPACPAAALPGNAYTDVVSGIECRACRVRVGGE